jgi:hypothetical protein
MHSNVHVWEIIRQVAMDMYSEKNLSERGKLRHNPSISSELHSFVDTLPRLGDGTFGFETYVQFCISVVKVLTVVISPEAARRIAEDDWMTDSKDGVMMPSLFENGMFELADIWTEGIDPEEYVEFLQNIHESVFTDENLKHLQEVATEEETQRLAEIGMCCHTPQRGKNGHFPLISHSFPTHFSLISHSFPTHFSLISHSFPCACLFISPSRGSRKEKGTTRAGRKRKCITAKNNEKGQNIDFCCFAQQREGRHPNPTRSSRREGSTSRDRARFDRLGVCAGWIGV